MITIEIRDELGEKRLVYRFGYGDLLGWTAGI